VVPLLQCGDVDAGIWPEQDTGRFFKGLIQPR
jgi:uncharacterized membrane protein